MKKRPQGRPRALTDEQVEEIRGKWDLGIFTQKELASIYTVHPLTIHNVIHEKGPYGPPVILVEDGQTTQDSESRIPSTS